MKQITEEQFVDILHDTFEMSEKLHSDSELTFYIKDSIDLGELLAALYERYAIRINPNMFRNVYTVGQALLVINSDGK